MPFAPPPFASSEPACVCVCVGVGGCKWVYVCGHAESIEDFPVPVF